MAYRHIIHENVAWDYIKVNEKCLELMKNADAVCFGSLSQRSETSREAILKLLNNTNNNCIKIFDINLRQNFYNREIIINSLAHANVLKLNELELSIVSDLLGVNGGEESEKLRKLQKKYSLRLIALTKGDCGSILFNGERISKHPGFKVEVLDTVGAGDAFTAAVAVGLIKKWDLDTINDFANKLGGYVCTQQGATPKIPEWLKASLFI